MFVLSTLKTTQEKLGGMIPGPKWARYGQSKLANQLYAKELAKRYPQIKTVSIHPGFIKTDIFADVDFMMVQFFRILVPLTEGWTDVAQGPFNQTWAGTTSRANLEDGVYYAPIAKKGKLETAASRDTKLATKLWDWTQKELEQW
jgi:NAD(P)-dependent dehydrogenase (short-subunit alcohol dehydrogenase family)